MVTTHNQRVIDAYDIFVEGQVVRLLTGGPPMTVIDVCDCCGDVTATYCNSSGDLDVIELPSVAVRFDDEWRP
ncbi:hypothetical protein N8A98_06900 [Devosia neptuniae]|uniref:Uncharacterized protein n=1 Tax=Devosia neptuniae TaxID=191302 RepID=A0ABY6CF88_9HYPH|nr:hypothetical protein [Devosia neptuniae]UXN70910.1 hypothetical protein N8A98_06900 [Devosia neptuniae]